MNVEDQVKALRERFCDRITIRNCSMCGYPCAYIFQGESLFYDSGCDCKYGELEPRDIRSLHQFLEMNPDWTEKKLAHAQKAD